MLTKSGKTRWHAGFEAAAITSVGWGCGWRRKSAMQRELVLRSSLHGFNCSKRSANIGGTMTGTPLRCLRAMRVYRYVADHK